jgi:hypothetical protein
VLFLVNGKSFGKKVSLSVLICLLTPTPSGSFALARAAMLRVGPDPKFGASFAVFVTSYVIVSICSGVALWCMPKLAPGWPVVNGTNAVLPDVGFDSVPYLGRLMRATESNFIGTFPPSSLFFS